MYLKIEETLVQHQQIKDMLTKLDHASPVSGLSIVFGTKNFNFSVGSAAPTDLSDVDQQSPLIPQHEPLIPGQSVSS
jgi:hypothetical protein|eukprot:COSAG03_NODE_778_length_5899_cov_2.776207_4_plen_77_part_00